MKIGWNILIKSHDLKILVKIDKKSKKLGKEQADSLKR